MERITRLFQITSNWFKSLINPELNIETFENDKCEFEYQKIALDSYANIN